MEVLSKVKKSMRIKHSEIDDDIQSEIDACILDLVRVGVNPYEIDEEGQIIIENDVKVIREDALIEMACKLYCKAQHDFEGKGDRHQDAYEKLRDALSLSGDYI